MGHNAGEEFEIAVKFPEDYHEESLKGKDTTFKVTIHAIRKKEVPVQDDEFAKDVSEFDTLEELKKDLREKLQERKTAAADERLENTLVDAAAANAQMEIPPVMVEHKIDEMVQDFDYRLQSQGLNLPTYLQYAGMEMPAFREGFAPQAQQQVRVALTLEAIAKAENLVAEEEAIEAEYQKMAQSYGIEVDKVKTVVSSSSIATNLCLNKAIDLIKSTAKVTDASAGEKAEEAAAEKEKPAKPKTTRKRKPKTEEKAEEPKTEE